MSFSDKFPLNSKNPRKVEEQTLAEFIEEAGLTVPDELKDSLSKLNIYSEDFAATKKALVLHKEFCDEVEAQSHSVIFEDFDELNDFLAISKDAFFMKKFPNAPEEYISELTEESAFISDIYMAHENERYAEQNQLWSDVCNKNGVEDISLIVVESDIDTAFVPSTLHNPDAPIVLLFSSKGLEINKGDALEAIFEHEMSHILDLKAILSGEMNIESDLAKSYLESGDPSPASKDLLHVKEYKAEKHASSQNQRLAMGAIHQRMISDSYSRSTGATFSILNYIMHFNSLSALKSEIAEKPDVAKTVEEYLDTQHNNVNNYAAMALDEDFVSITDPLKTNFYMPSETHPSEEEFIKSSWGDYVKHRPEAAAEVTGDTPMKR